ncbi:MULTISPECIES: hypothetical protein [Streptomyces]|uniref:hypothetical protein n=1 Tax=Streptomyces TaxID=1883 RepID=UPI002E2E494F|nr:MULTISPECIES: hypothetical protein [Streptomyces]
MSPNRDTWTTEQIRAEDLQPNDVALLAGRWREVLYHYRWNDDPTYDFCDWDPALQQVFGIISRAGNRWIAVALIDDSPSATDEPEREIVAFLWCDLVTVQKRVPREPSAGKASPPGDAAS